MNLDKLIIKTFKNASFKKDGIVYKIMDVEPQKGERYNFYVNVVLPEKNQSYLHSKFEYDLNDYIGNIYKYIGVSFGYYLHIFVNGEPAEEIYIRPELVNEMIEGVKQKFKKISIGVGRFREKSLVFDMELIPAGRTANASFITVSDENIEFYFKVKVSNFKLDGKDLNPLGFYPEKLRDFAGYINDLLYDTEFIRENLESFIYYTLEPEVKIKDTDMYYTGSMFLSEIDGQTAKANWGDFRIEDFIS
jgi:hypothetical protein